MDIGVFSDSSFSLIKNISFTKKPIIAMKKKNRSGILQVNACEILTDHQDEVRILTSCC
ncbi:MAG: hypothetical protein QRY71_01960 [Candidatus Rhabdochlamydia sp.]